MKKILLLAAVATLSSPAFASKARLNALGNADHLVDNQVAFDNPATLAQFGDYATFEMGPTNNSSSFVPGTTTWEDVIAGLPEQPQAEGGFVKSMDDQRFGMYFGRKSQFTDSARRAFGFLRQENTLELQYARKADLNWGAALNYSSSDKKADTPVARKQQAMGIRLGATTGNWEAFAVIGLGSTATGLAGTSLLTGPEGTGVITGGNFTTLNNDADAKYTGTAGFKLGAAYKMDSLRFYGKYYQDGFKFDSTVNSSFNGLKMEQSQFDLGAIDAIKHDGGHWFYGAALQMFNSKTSISNVDKKVTAMMMPFIAGIEHEALSWMVVRASVTQNVLLGSRKYDDGALAAIDEANTINNNTKVAAGLGLKLNKWMVDGALAAQSTGSVNATNFMTNVAMTYMF